MNPKNKKSIKNNGSKKVKNKKSKKKSEKSEKKKSEKSKDSIKKLGIIVLDLDETLFHTKGNSVFYRPHVKKFISFINKYFYLVVYTAALKTYADKILYDLLGEENMKKIFILKLYRNSVTNNGKDLKLVLNKIIEKENKYNIPSKFIYKSVNQKKIFNYDNIILIDNLVENFIDDQFFNGIPIIDYTGDDKDSALVLLIKFFKYFLKKKGEDKKLTLKMYLYNNLYKINSICKIQYQKCK
tara:strand:- start:377 stop:1099 length:723 start_codon:yes stop_codon:yes gene_type:complete